MRALLVVGKYPKGAAYLKGRVVAFRKALEARVVEIHGELNIVHSALCQSAAQHEGRRSLAMRWLAEEADKLPAGERLAFLRDASAAADARDKCISSLCIATRRNEADPWAALEARRPPAATSPPAIGEPISDR